MYLQSCRESKAAQTQTDVEQPSKLDDKPVLADVILQAVSKETQLGHPIGSPIMNGFRKQVAIPTVDKTENGVVNQAFHNENNDHEDFEKRKNEVNRTINAVNESKTGIENAAFEGET